MPTETTPYDTALYAQWRHCEQAHGARLGVHEDCPTCVALAHAVWVAQQRETQAHARPLEESC
jgi:hypothetical protein